MMAPCCLRPCELTRDDSDGEIFVVGLYVDNLQIVHSVDIDDKGNVLVTSRTTPSSTTG